MSEVEEILNRIKTHKSVHGIIIINKEAAIIRTTYTGEKKEEGEAIAKAIHQLTLKAKSTVKDLNKDDELKFLRVRSQNNEIMVAPDKEFILIVVQGPRAEIKEEGEN